MGRVSEMFVALNATSFPTTQQQEHYYCHLNLSGENGVAIKKARRGRRTAERKHLLIKQGGMFGK